MAIITVEGLGKVEIAGDTPNSQEIENIRQALETSRLSIENILTIKEYKKQNPESASVPDLELAEKVFKEDYEPRGVDENTYFESAFPKIAAKRGTDEIILPDDEFNENFEFKSDKPTFKPTTSEIAKSAGVSTNDPATSAARFGGSLGYNQEQKKLAIKNSLSKLYGVNVDVRTGPETGKLEYFNPKTESYALVDAPGLDRGDFADLGGDAMIILPDLAVTFATAGLGKAIGGGALAAAAGEYTRLKLGQKIYGINQDLTDMQLFQEGLKVGAISLGAGVTGVGIAKAIKGVNNMIKGRSYFQIEAGVKALDDPKVLQADTVASNINKTLEDAGSKSRLKFSLAEALDDPDLLATQAAFENTRRLGKLKEFQEFGQNQANALNEYFKLTKSIYGNSTGTAYDTGVVFKEVLEKRNKESLKNIVKKQEASEALLEKKIFNLPDGNSKVTGVQFRSIINDLSTTYKSNAKLIAAELDKTSAAKFINTDVVAKAIGDLSEKEKKNFIKIAKLEGIFKDADIFNKLADPNGTIALANARESISTLGKLIRDKQFGLAAGETPDVGRLMKLKSALTKQVKNDAGADYLNELEKFNELVIRNKEALNNDIISKLTKIEIGSVLKVGDEAIFETTFKTGANNVKEAKEVYEVISKSPEALNAYKNSIFAKYKADVLDPFTKKPSLTKHNAFMKNYKEPLKIFFKNEAEFNKISRIGGLQRNIEKTNKALTQINKEINKSFEGKLFNASPSEIFNRIYKPGNIGEIRTVKNILVKNDSVYKKFQRDVLTDLNERITVDGVLNPKAFNNYLNGAGGERGYKAALREVFGKEYVKNLDTLNNALQVIARKPPSRAAEGVVANAFTDIIRARLGQFTTPGRIFTAGRRLFTSASNRVIARALLNPTSLKDLLALRQLPRSSKRAMAILAKLGGSIFILPDDGAPIPPKSAVIEQDAPTSNLTIEDFEDIISPEGTKIGVRKVIEPTASVAPITPPINTGIMQVNIPLSQTGLTSTEQALLSPEEQSIRLRQRGMA